MATVFDEDSDAKQLKPLKQMSFSFQLLDKEDQPKWIQHADGQDVDLAAIAMPKKLPDRDGKMWTSPKAVNVHSKPDLPATVGDDVYILGFPLGYNFYGSLPIWKRGSIASEPEVQIDGYDIILVDTATREGMSGSPVLARARSFVHHSRATNKSSARTGTVTSLTGKPMHRFIGVYSGRYGTSQIEAQLGKVWLESQLVQLFENPKTGSWELRKLDAGH